MSEVNGVIVIVKLDAKCQSVVPPRCLPTKGVLVVAHVLACPLPAFAWDLGLGIRVHKGTHSVVVETVGLQQINDVKPVCPAFLCVRKPEVKPLIVRLRICVWLQDEVVLKLVHLDGSSQVGWFEARFKAQGVVVVAWFLVVGLKISTVVTVLYSW